MAIRELRDNSQVTLPQAMHQIITLNRWPPSRDEDDEGDEGDEDDEDDEDNDSNVRHVFNIDDMDDDGFLQRRAIERAAP